MNRRQNILLYFVVAGLVATWLYPPCIIHSDMMIINGEPSGQPDGLMEHRFLLGGRDEYEISRRIDWSKLVLSDVIIVAVGASILYALRSKS
jgi:hypothetical protein